MNTPPSIRTPSHWLRAGILTGLVAVLGAATAATVQAGDAAEPSPEAAATTPAPVASAPPAERLKVRRADRRQGPATAINLARKGCMSDPAQCRCSHKDPKKSALCAPVIGHFCPDSTLKYMASKCVDLFGGVTVCKCAANSEIQSYISKEEAAERKRNKKKKKKGKKKKGKKKSG